MYGFYIRPIVAAVEDDTGQFGFSFQPQSPQSEADIGFNRLKMREK